MSNKLIDKITIVIGSASPLANEIIKSFLSENATGIVPVNSSNDFIKLKQYLRECNS